VVNRFDPGQLPNVRARHNCRSVSNGKTAAEGIEPLPKYQPEQDGENGERDGASDEEVGRGEVGTLSFAIKPQPPGDSSDESGQEVEQKH